MVSTITTKAKKSTSVGSKVDARRSRVVVKVKSVAIHKTVRRKQQFLGAVRWWDPLHGFTTTTAFSMAILKTLQ